MKKKDLLLEAFEDFKIPAIQTNFIFGGAAQTLEICTFCLVGSDSTAVLVGDDCIAESDSIPGDSLAAVIPDFVHDHIPGLKG